MAAEFTAEEIRKLRELLEIEAIRKTRNLYSHLMDTGRVDELADLFTEDGLCEFGPYGVWKGRDTIRTNFEQIESGNVYFAMHNTCNHWVELTDTNTAAGRCYLIDAVTRKAPDENPIVWFAIYDEDYRKVDDRWLIARCTLQFTWPERHLTEGFPGPFPP